MSPKTVRIARGRAPDHPSLAAALAEAEAAEADRVDALLAAVRASRARVTDADRQRVAAAGEQKDAMQAAYDGGLSLAQVGEAAGISRQRVHQLGTPR